MEVSSMKQSFQKFSLAALLGAVLGMNLSAQAQEVAVGVKAGTLGMGIEVVTPLRSNLDGRLGFNYFSLDDSQDLTDIDYDIDLTLLTFSALLDWHPFGNSFRLSGGAFYNGNNADVKSKAAGSVDIGNQTFFIGPADQVSGEVDFRKFAPYLGFGWGNNFGNQNKIAVSLDFGLLFQGSGNVDLKVNGLLASAPGIDIALSQEESEAENEFDDYTYYPVISLGLSYRF
jgi:hypothetical protein